MDQISVIVCTYNRADLLDHCLSSLVPAFIDASKNDYEVIIVDNNSSDHTAITTQKYTTKYDHFKYLIEYNQGLSYSKNRGYKEAKYNWITYLDDDAKARPGYITKAKSIINNYNFDCFGGRYIAWYEHQKPRWVPDWFGTKPCLRNDIGIIHNGFLSGSVSFYKKSILEKLGGFPVEMGMKGNKTAYGEEDFLQGKMRNHGYIIGFDPSLEIDHLVNTHKLSPGWFIKSQFVQGKTNVLIAPKRSRFNDILKSSFSDLLGRIKINTIRLFRREINITTYYVNIIYPFSFRMGVIYGIIKQKRFNHLKNMLISRFKRLAVSSNYQKFVIVAHARTGTNLIVDLLKQHPNIEVHGECFKDVREESCDNIWNGIFDKKYYKIDAVGFKLFYYHPVYGSDQSIWETLKNNTKTKVIHLTRANILRTIISQKLAHRNNSWCERIGSDRAAKKKDVFLDTSECEQKIRQIICWQNETMKKFENHEVLEIKYEDFVKDINGSFDRLVKFLGVNHFPAKINLRKQNPEPINELLSNFDDLKEHFKNSDLGKYFNFR
jgi:glycosyltransferase involved in cell wall biosynthesis